MSLRILSISIISTLPETEIVGILTGPSTSVGFIGDGNPPDPPPDFFS